MIEVYTDIRDVPLDVPPPDVGDWTPENTHARLLESSLAVSVAPSGFVVPFTREMKRGARGRDVAGAKRAIWRATGTSGLTRIDELFNAKADRLLRKFQDAHGLPVDGELGPATLKKLGPYFDRYAFFLYEGYMLGTNPVAVKRSKMLAYLIWGYNHRALIYYAQFRPMTLMNDLYHLPVADDCSTRYTKGAKAAGWRDPNGFNYNGTGNTETLVVHGRRVDLEHAQIGDAVLYSSPQHVAGYVGHGRVIGHGSNAGPSLTDAHYRRDYWQTRDYLT
jgi:hypothetical protein